VGLASETLLVPALILIFFLLYYPSVIKIEEQRLHRRHLSSFQTYLTRVPAFIPKPGKLIEPESYSIHPRVVKHSMMDAICFIWLCGLVSLTNKLHTTGILPEWILLF
jgi:hypothetical protein